LYISPKVIAEVPMKIPVLCEATLCHWVSTSRHFEESGHLHLQRSYPWRRRLHDSSKCPE